MISRKQVVDLLHFKAGSGWVLSFYLGIGVYKSKAKAYEIEAKDIMKAAVGEAGLSDDDRAKVEEDVQKILGFLKMDFKGRARGLAIFASGGTGLWQVFRLPVAVPDRCVVNHSPYVLPMLKLVDEGRRYCIVVADKAKARVFTMYQGELSERTEIFDLVPGWHKQGGWAQARFQRHIKDAANKHLKHVADTVFEFYKREGFGHLIIGGAQEVRTRLFRIMHSYLQRTLAGYVTVDVVSNSSEVLTAARRIEEETENRRSQKIARALLGDSDQGYMTVTGLKDTVRALEKGRVHTLVMVDGEDIEGCLCGDCGGVDVLGAKTCPYCRKKVGREGDISEHLAVLAVHQDAEVSYVNKGAGLEAKDGVGAILRW
jgi:peptide chain release factor subunit 1